MYQTSDWIKAISRLSRLTIENAVKWKQTNLEDDELPEPSDRLVRAFACQHNNMKYQVFEVRSRNYTDEDTFYWFPQYFLDIFKRGFSPEYVFITRSPALPIVGDLLRTVERAYARQEGALDDLLGGDNETDE
jgi:hypothetical protein